MSLLGRYTQQPGERRKRGIDYTAFLEEDEEVTDVSVSVSPITDTPFEIENILIDPDGKEFAYFAQGGESGQTYTVTFTVETSGGQRLEDEIEFDIEEVS